MGQADPLEKFSIEPVDPGRSGKVALRNAPSAFASLFRIVSFRTTIPIGLSAVASVSETAFILGYMGALFGWLFVNSRSISVISVHLMLIDTLHSS